MLAPEVSLLPPKSFEVHFYNDSKIIKHVSQQFFNHAISLTLPFTTDLPSEVSDFYVDSDYYHIKGLPAFELLDRQFINLFIRTGQLTLHSVGTRLDHDNCLAVNPKGTMTLSLTRDTFRSLGLEGKKSEYVHDRFIVTLDIYSTEFTSNEKVYNRTLERLKAMNDLKFDVILSWESPSAEICPSSIAAWFNDASYNVSCCSNKHEKDLFYNQDVPDLDATDLSAILEWTGMMHLGGEVIPNICDISSYQIESPMPMKGTVLTAKWTGFFSSSRVLKAITNLREWVDNKTLNVWVSLTIHGLEDSITTFGDREHQYYLEGDYSTSLVMKNGLPTTALVHVSSNRAPRGRKRTEI